MSKTQFSQPQPVTMSRKSLPGHPTTQTCNQFASRKQDHNASADVPPVPLPDSEVPSGTVTREMVWQRDQAGPLAKLFASHPNYEILIISDKSATRRLIRSALLSLGFSNIGESDGTQEAIAAMRRNIPDLAIVDRDLTETDGITFIRALRSGRDSPAPQLPVIMMAEISDPKTLHDIRNAGATEILAKPFTPNALARQIGSVVQNERAFVQASDFCGPDRRRKQRPFEGTERRLSTMAENDETTHWI